MAAIDPTLLLKLTGSQSVTDINNSNSWTLSTKIEQNIIINNTSQIHDVDLTDVSNIRFIVILATDDFTARFTHSSETIDFECQDILVLTPTTHFVSELTALSIFTDKSSAVTVEIRIYGEN